MAHASMLGEQGIISRADAENICTGLRGILADVEAGTIEFSADNEDIHMNVETILTARIGEAGKRLHTARSRNDQVALDFRLYLRRQIGEIVEQLLHFQKVLLQQARQHTETVMPGYTHLQRAQPITFAHHLLAYAHMLCRDVTRLEDCRARMNECPLGSGALAGTTYPIDRFATAGELGFDRPMGNSLDGVIDLDDAYSTGSSIMPQKKNPDVAELVRGKTGRVYGSLMSLLTAMKSLPLAYNKDMQEDKEPVFDAIDTVKLCIPVFAGMIETMTVHPENMRRAAGRGFINATDCADYLTKKGMPFRDAYTAVGNLVYYCQEQGKTLEELTLEELQRTSPLFEADVYEALNLENCAMSRASFGGPAKAEAARQIREIEAFIQTRENV